MSGRATPLSPANATLRVTILVDDACGGGGGGQRDGGDDFATVVALLRFFAVESSFALYTCVGGETDVCFDRS